MKLKLQICAAIAIVTIMLAAPASARADAVADWNAIAVQAIITAGPVQRPGPTGVLDIAMVQAAVYDAVQAIEKEFEPYYVEIPGASGSPVAATAKAAHDVLVNRFPCADRVPRHDLPPVSGRPCWQRRPWGSGGGNRRCRNHRPAGIMTGVSLTQHRRPSSAAPLRASGARRPRPSRRCSRRGWATSLPSP